MALGMVPGEYASHMPGGLELKGWLLLVGHTETALVSVKHATFCYPKSFLRVDGEKAIYHVKTRCTQISRTAGLISSIQRGLCWLSLVLARLRGTRLHCTVHLEY